MTVAVAASLEDVLLQARDAAADPSDRALDAAARVVADTIAVAHAGARTPAHERLVERLSEPASQDRRANVVADRPRWAPPHLAALLNATAAVTLELDEALVGGGHPAAQVVPAALAVAQSRDATGEALAAAVLLGYDVAARLHRTRRFVFPAHPHGAIGAIGAAVAVAELEGGDQVRAAQCAATLPLLPSWAACFEGATARNAWTGVAAMIGVLAADLAEVGFTGSTAAALEALKQVTEPTGAALSADPLIFDSATRVYPVAAPLQSAVEAAVELGDQLEGRPTTVEVETVAANRKFDRLPLTNELSARFTLPFAVAWGLGGAEQPLRVTRPRLVLARLVDVIVSQDLERSWPRYVGAHVMIANASGKAEATCRVPLGHPDRPLSPVAAQERWGRLLEPRRGMLEPLLHLRRRQSAELLEDADSGAAQ